LGNYATITELQARFEDTAAVSHVTDSDDDLTPDTDVLTEELNAAEGLIDSYLGRRHATPIAVSGDTVLAAWMKSVTLDIAVVRLLRRPGQGIVPDEVAESYTEAVDWCKAVASGAAVLPATLTQATTTAMDPLSEWGSAPGSSSTRVCTRETQENV